MLKISLCLVFCLLMLNESEAFEVKGPTSTKFGYRFQGVMSQLETESASRVKTNTQDFYLRRARVEFSSDWGDGLSQSLDIRNDKIGFGDRGMGSFRLGDAYFSKKWESGDFNHDLRAFKAKVDISRVQTASSASLIYLNRPHSTVFAAGYLSQNRRANNLQWNGAYKKKLAWHLVVGDGVNSSQMEDALGQSIDSVTESRWIYGAKLRWYIFGISPKKISETFYGDDDFLSLGAGLFHSPTFTFKKGTVEAKGDRNLTNVELTLKYGAFRLMAEYFSFSRVHNDFTTSLTQHGRGESFYVQSETFFSEKWSTFLRYEMWERIKQMRDLRLKNYVTGINYYHKRNKFKFGLFFDHTENGSNTALDRSATSVALTTMIHFK